MYHTFYYCIQLLFSFFLFFFCFSDISTRHYFVTPILTLVKPDSSIITVYTGTQGDDDGTPVQVTVNDMNGITLDANNDYVYFSDT